MPSDPKRCLGHVAGDKTLVIAKNSDSINCEKELMKARKELLTEHKRLNWKIK
jgi:hypothetical protein